MEKRRACQKYSQANYARLCLWTNEFKRERVCIIRERGGRGRGREGEREREELKRTWNGFMSRNGNLMQNIFGCYFEFLVSIIYSFLIILELLKIISKKKYFKNLNSSRDLRNAPLGGVCDNCRSHSRSFSILLSLSPPPSLFPSLLSL